jgi:hypothetical protein
MAQGVLSAIDGDVVNSISDTVESGQVADLIKQCYYEMVDELNLPHKNDLMSLEGLADPLKPTHMHIPDNASQILWIKYDCRTLGVYNYDYRTLRHEEPETFIRTVNQRDVTDTTNHLVVQYSANIPLVICKTAAPRSWTSFDDEYVVFDSYDSAVESTVQASKTITYGATAGVFIVDDDYIPDLPDNLFTHLYSKVEARAFANHKQQLNQKSEQQERRSRIRIQRNKHKAGRKVFEGPNFGK